jgi:hypothetical protein
MKARRTLVSSALLCGTAFLWVSLAAHAAKPAKQAPSPAPAAQAGFTVGAKVWAAWQPNGWYHGTIASPCKDGFNIDFDDGDKKCCKRFEIGLDVPPAKADVKTGSPVLALWTDGRYYPALVKAVKGEDYQIDFLDGSNAVLKLAQLRARIKGIEDLMNAASNDSGGGDSAADSAGASEITLRKGGSLWASVEANGTIRIDGSLAGEFESNGNVRRGGSLVGEVEENGTIRFNGSIVGEIESNGTLRHNGSIIGEIESGGTIRLSGSIWGSAEKCCGSSRDRRAVAAVLAFFTADFGF